MTSDEESRNFKAAVKALVKSVEGNSLDDEKAGETRYSCKPLIRLFEASSQQDSLGLALTTKQQRLLLLETIRHFPKKQANRFFSGLKSIVEQILAEEAYIPASAFEDEDTDAADSSKDVKEDMKSNECLQFLRHVAECVQAFVEGRRDHAKEKGLVAGSQILILPQVYDVAVDLHSVLFSLHTCGAKGVTTQNAVLKVCETWWLANGVHRETLIAQCLPLLVLKALEDNESQNTYIKRIFQLNKAFLVIDFTKPSSDSLRSLLLRVASSPRVLRLGEGKKLLACLLQDPDLVEDLHLSFRAQFPETRKSVLRAYGEIYFRAWKKSLEDTSEEVQDAIEHKALQDLMHASIHLSSQATLNSVVTVLEPIFNDKKATKTAEVLYRLYNPILWRSLSSANPLVRKNSVAVLEKVFPLHNPAFSQAKEAVEKGTNALKSALQDKDPRVRVAAAAATANICSLFWEALPSTEIRTLLNHIVMGHASDASSAAVRVSALEAVSKLLEIPQSHAVLRALLPSLGNLIHDRTERVRLAAVRMLLKIKETRGIRFYHVVPVEHLTSRLSEENRIHENPRNAIAKELTALLLNSYFPQGPTVSGADQLKRALSFFLTDPSAGIVFYANLSDLLDEEAVVKFIAMLLACLKSAVETDQAKHVRKCKNRKKRRRQGECQQNDGNDSDEQQNLSASNTALMLSLVETISLLVESVVPLLRDDSPCKNLLLARLREIDVVNVLSHFEQISCENTSQSDAETQKRADCLRIYGAILRCLGQLPQDTVQGIVDLITTSMSSFTDENRPLHFILSHFVPLCVWGMNDNVAHALAKSIESAYENEISFLSPSALSLDKSISNHHGSGKKAHDDGAVELPMLSPDVALAVVNRIIRGGDSSSAFLREQILSSERASSAVRSALNQGIVFAERLFLVETGFGTGHKESYFEYILSSCELYGKFVLHQAAKRGDNLTHRRQVTTLLDWATTTVLPAFLGARPEDNTLRNLDLSRISNVSDSLALSPPRQKADLRRTPIRFGRESNSTPLDGGNFLMTSFTASLLQSACLFFAEEIVMGISDGNDIAEKAVTWCIVFNEAGKESIEGAEHILEGLLPSFLRLAVQLCNSCSNPKLLIELLVRYNETSLGDGSGQMKQAIASLLKPQFGAESKLCSLVVEAVLSAGKELFSSSDIDFPEAERAETIEELCLATDGCLKLAIKEILSNKDATIELAKQLVLSLSSRGEEISKAVVFEEGEVRGALQRVLGTVAA
eukprot:scaffold4949_cov134-Cylindrotheca_fusiformis.AAC.2